MKRLKAICSTCGCLPPDPRSFPSCNIIFAHRLCAATTGAKAPDNTEVPRECVRYLEHVVMGQDETASQDMSWLQQVPDRWWNTASVPVIPV
jgi:hypothetical protein